MTDKDFPVSVPQEVVGGFGRSKLEVTNCVRDAPLTQLLRFDQLSEAHAAAILGLARRELFELIGCYDVPVVRMTVEELDRELATAVKRDGVT
jgi:hypothetical protein